MKATTPRFQIQVTEVSTFRNLWIDNTETDEKITFKKRVYSF